MAEYQIREYRVKSGKMDDFLKQWRTEIVPLRKKIGFVVIGGWMDRKDNRFIWIVGWEGAGTFEEANARYYSSPERMEISPDPRTYLEEIKTTMMTSAM